MACEKEYLIFDKKETTMQSVVSDFITFGFLIFSIWFSYHLNQTIWEYLTVVIFLISLSVEIPAGSTSRWIKLKTKKDAIKWANSLEA